MPPSSDQNTNDLIVAAAVVAMCCFDDLFNLLQIEPGSDDEPRTNLGSEFELNCSTEHPNKEIVYDIMKFII